MIPSETTGIFSTKTPLIVEPGFIVSWKSSLEATKRIKAVKPLIMVVPHSGCLSGTEVEEYLDKEREAILEAKELIFCLSAEGKTEEEILSVFQTTIFDRRSEAFKEFFPLSAFTANYRVMIPRTLAEGA